MKVFMIIIFMVSSGEQIVPPGMEPREFNTIEECELKLAAAVEFIEYGIRTEKLPRYYIGYKAECVQSEDVAPSMQ